ncbi:MAG: sigma-54 dependent transcriptional regulator [Bacteriovoracales bacterium]|nr:sigma-54 dependent transcriptional regulator [Bacteriovoracales bacterium]
MAEKDTIKEVSVLIIDDEKTSLAANELSVRRLLDGEGFESHRAAIFKASSIEEALSVLRKQVVHVVLLDKDLGEDEKGRAVNGISYIPEILDIQPMAQVLMITGNDDTRLAVKAIQSGACGYVVKGGDGDKLEYRNTQILKALERSKTEIERAKERLQGEKGHGKYICESQAMQALESQLKALAEYPAPVLFLGESGLGKTAAAKRLGQLRGKLLGQKDRPFFNINMANIPKNLADSMLFGHEKGAFTGADKARQGLFELAAGGDLFLDEIGEADLEVQAKLLKVIEEKEFYRVGGKKAFRSNARLILATNRDLKEMVIAKGFREDLYARICSFDITLPSLEDRKEDIPYICESIIEGLCREHPSQKTTFTYADFPESLKEYLQRDNIPFNIRGIRNDIERLFIISNVNPKTGRLDFTNWKAVLGLHKKSVFYSKKPVESITYKDFTKLPTAFLGDDFPGLKEAKHLFEKKLMEEAASKCKTKMQVADILKISKTIIAGKLYKYNVTVGN